MRFLSPFLIAGVLLLASLSASDAAEAPASTTPSSPATQAPAAVPEATSGEVDQTSQTTAAPASDAPADTSGATQVAAEAAESTPETTVAAAQIEPKSVPAEPAAAPTVVTAKIDPELALRLSLLEKTMLAQTNGQNQIYSETTRLLMFFGTACVAMGLIAMVAAVFLMNRTLASVSAITAQVAQVHAPQALPAAGSTLIAAPGTNASGFEKVQASGQRFQNRMTSLEQRLQELEHLAGHAPATPATAEPEQSGPNPIQEADTDLEIAPRRSIPVAAILVRKAEALMNLGKLDDAMSALDEAGKQPVDQSEVHLARGRVLEKLGRLGDALESYDLAASTDQTNTAALLMKAGVLNRQERFDEALSCYERALAVHRASN